VPPDFSPRGTGPGLELPPISRHSPQSCKSLLLTWKRPPHLTPAPPRFLSLFHPRAPQNPRRVSPRFCFPRPARVERRLFLPAPTCSFSSHLPSSSVQQSPTSKLLPFVQASFFYALSLISPRPSDTRIGPTSPFHSSGNYEDYIPSRTAAERPPHWRIPSLGPSLSFLRPPHPIRAFAKQAPQIERICGRPPRFFTKINFFPRFPTVLTVLRPLPPCLLPNVVFHLTARWRLTRTVRVSLVHHSQFSAFLSSRSFSPSTIPGRLTLPPYFCPSAGGLRSLETPPLPNQFPHLSFFFFPFLVFFPAPILILPMRHRFFPASD